MYFEEAEPPIIRRRVERSAPNRSYHALFTALAASPGTWLAVNPDHVTGATAKAKVCGLHNAATNRKVLIQTTIQEGVVYVRQVTTPQEVANVR
jgi:hypothetical protein